MHPDGSLFAYYNDKTGCVSVYSLQQKAEVVATSSRSNVILHVRLPALRCLMLTSLPSLSVRMGITWRLVIPSFGYDRGHEEASLGTKDGEIKLWDLRKATDFATLTAAGPVEDLSFDHSGHYLAAGKIELEEEWDVSFSSMQDQ